MRGREFILHAPDNSEVVMKRILWSLPIILCLMTGAPAFAQDKVRINPTDPQPTCTMCPGTYIPAAELDGYTKKAVAEKLVDQQVRDVDIGKAHIGIGMVHRGRLEKPAPDSVAEHDHVSEAYHVISGAATLVLGPDIVNRQRRPATLRTVVEFNGPGNNGSEVRDGIAYEIKAGDVVVIPAGTGHWFTRIEDHIDYLMVRIDPDKLTPLKSEAQSQEYLARPAKRGEGRPDSVFKRKPAPDLIRGGNRFASRKRVKPKIYRAVTASSRASASCSCTNSSAKPSSRFRTTRAWTFPSMTRDFKGGRFSAAMAAPDSDMSMTRQVILVPSSSVSSEIGLRGTIRSWRRSSGRFKMSRLASQVSWAASLSRLRAVAPTLMAKPLSIMRVILPSTRPIWSR